MRLVLVTTGSLGDVTPFLALALGLKQAGYSVRLAGPADARSLCQENEIDFYAIDEGHQVRLQEEEQKHQLSSGNTLQFAYHRLQSKQHLFLNVHRAAYQACNTADGIIYRIGGFLEMDSVAEKLQIPCFKVGLVPYTPTREFPSLYLSPINNLGRSGNWLSYPLAEYARWLFFGKSLNQFRRIDLGLPKINFIQSRNHLSSGLPLFYAFSPTLLPRPYDWSEQVKITGHWMLEQEKNWQPPELLVNFLNNGTSPLYVGFGSMVLQNPQQLLDRITGALTETGQRGIFTGDWQGRQNSLSANDQFMWIDRVPHEWLFPQVRAAIHHGGIGTTTNCLKAGIPSIIVPFNYDQPFWGERVKKIGAGPQPIPANQLTQAVLVKAIQDCMDDQEMHQVVRQLQAKINKENGINETIQRIHQDLPLNASIL